MRNECLLFALAIALGASALPALAADNSACAITAAPNPPFVPPAQFAPYTFGDGEHFLYGTPDLWALVFTRWKLGSGQGNKLPYFSVRYDWKTEKRPQMTVEAKRIDEAAPTVRGEEVIGAGPSSNGFPAEQPDPTKPGAMLTRLRIPAAGCWEITAKYTPPTGTVQKLSYRVLVEP